MNPLDIYGCSITLAAQANQAPQNDDDGARFSERTTRRTMDSGKTWRAIMMDVCLVNCVHTNI
jgi:hypothetical protein